ncbi:MAG: alpha/beta hydrolase [Burkholderiaceae bacterium]|nr:alpha/beta hydrolase [Burkholderiaceae bacterium]
MWFDVNGRRAYAYTGGRSFDPAAPVVAFVHGAQHDHSVWILQSRYLAHHGRSVLAVDLPGHGRSAGPALATVEAMADWLQALLAAAGVAKAALVGHSMGSLIALETAARAPQLAERLALLGVAVPMKVSDVLLNAARDHEPDAFAMINAWSHSSLTPRPGTPGPGFSVYWQNRRLMERQAPGVLFNDFNACNAYENGLAAADEVRCPVLVVSAARDMMTPPKAARELLEHLRQASARPAPQAGTAPAPPPRVVSIAGSGHAMMAEQPDRVLEALRDFV